jgi:hypothetical protein
MRDQAIEECLCDVTPLTQSSGTELPNETTSSIASPYTTSGSKPSTSIFTRSGTHPSASSS